MEEATWRDGQRALDRLNVLGTQQRSYAAGPVLLKTGENLENLEIG